MHIHLAVQPLVVNNSAFWFMFFWRCRRPDPPWTAIC